MMKTSVVMAVYNGEKYLTEQLDSIRCQTQQPDEVVICDDGSTDHSISLINEYIAQHQLSGWHVYRNPSNKGLTLNFLDGAAMATGDVLFFSDQDDVWHTDKIRRMCQAMMEKDALALYCLADTIDSSGQPVTNRLQVLNRVKSSETLHQLTLSEKLKYARSPGLCLAFRKELLPDVRRMALDYHTAHDLPVGTAAAVQHRYYVLNEVLMHHRVHANNASAPDVSMTGSIKRMDKQITSRQTKLNELCAIRDLYSDLLSEQETRTLNEAIRLTTGVIDSLRSRKPGGIIRAMLSGNAMMNRALAVRNLLAVLRGSKK